MPRVCTHCSDSSGFFWVRCFGTRCASLCKRARPAPPGIRPVYFRLARNFFCPPPPPCSPLPGQMPAAFALRAVPPRRCSAPRPRAGLSGGTGRQHQPWHVCPHAKRGKKRQIPRLARGCGHSPPAQPEPGTPGISGAGRRQEQPGEDLLLQRAAASSWITLRSGGVWESVEWRWRGIALATAGCASPVPAACRAGGSRRPCPIDPRPLTAPAASPHPGWSPHPLRRAPLPAVGTTDSVRIHVMLCIPQSIPGARPRCRRHVRDEPPPSHHPEALFLVFIPPRAAMWPVHTRLVLNANLTSRRGRRRTTYAQ